VPVVKKPQSTAGSLLELVLIVAVALGLALGICEPSDLRGGGLVGSDCSLVPRVEALLQLQIESYAPDQVPQELFDQYGPAVKPGSTRHAAAQSL